ncbi:MAG: Gfo/Idh/MocA family oxidoreductase [Planctomycetes bacterium]|nr:Gfo/Idh/MocA family oxidoreductase [Planctomycetota bacterium]
MKKLKVAVCGLGRLGAFHLEKYLQIEGVEVVCAIEPDEARAKEVLGFLPVPRFASASAAMDEIGEIDAASICTPTVNHLECAKPFLERGVHCLIEKPLADSAEAAREIVRLAKNAGVVAQVGHVERFNPGFIALRNHVDSPRFCEVHRLAPFSFRSMDIGVVHDLMIHDLDILLVLIGSKIRSIHAVGVNIVSPEKEDIANVRLEFENGCVANLTASRVTLSPMRKIRLFCPHAYLSLDLAQKKALIYKKSPTLSLKQMQDELGDLSKPVNWQGLSFADLLTIEEIDTSENDALKLEIESFLRAVRGEIRCEVPAEEGLSVIEVADAILTEIRRSKRELFGAAETSDEDFDVSSFIETI